MGTGTLVLDFANMAEGDRVGLSLLRDISAWVGVRRDGSNYRVGFANNITMNYDRSTNNTGVITESTPISTKKVWLRVLADIQPKGPKTGQFFWSTDGKNFIRIGDDFPLNPEWRFFMGYRYGIFNYATKALGGSVVVKSFTSA